MPLSRHTGVFEDMYLRYNRRQFVHPDPLEFLYLYEDPADREVVAIIASSLAYGRVAQILNSVRRVLDALAPWPLRTIRDSRPAGLLRRLGGFKHRFATDEHMAGLLMGVRKTIAEHGSLGRCFEHCMDKSDETVLPAMGKFVRQINHHAGGPVGHLLADPATGSACKRLNLLLRWMARRDEVDVGDWSFVPPAKLVVPLDTHMHDIGRSLGALRRASSDGRAAVELTAAFRKIAPDDPVKFDFALTRLGIRGELDKDELFRRCGVIGHE